MPNAPDAAVAEAALLARGAVEELPAGALADRLRAARAEGRQLRVKLGIDPTAPDVHLGHAVVLGKLREFQDAGHRVVLIVGDYTARVGDPSGRSELRPMLSEEEIEANARTFRDQASRILDTDPERLEVRRNSEWLELGMAELLRLVRTTTVAQLLERDDFAARWAARKPISMLELLYPLLQGYDSVAVRADVELGGTDQKFNLLMGRDIQRAYGQPEQAALTMGILVGMDGSRKMSKSLGNQIGVTDAPEEMYGKTMRIPDEAMGEYYRLLLGRGPSSDPRPDQLPSSPDLDQPPDQLLPSSDLDQLPDQLLPNSDLDQPPDQLPSSPDFDQPPDQPPPREAKRALARALVGWLHSPEQALAAERDFDRVFVDHRAPEHVDEALVQAGEDGTVHLPEAMAQAFGMSRSQARRLIEQGGVSLDDATLEPQEHDVAVERADGALLKVGKRRFRRLRAG